MSILHLNDCIAGMEDLGDETINLTITSPPYNLGATAVKNPVTYATYSDDKEHNEYILWLQKVFEVVYRKTTEDGRLAINIGDQRNGAIPTHIHLVNALHAIGWHSMSTIIWNKNQTRNRAAWGSWKSPSSPSFPSPFEYILIFYKNSKRLTHSGEIDITADEFKKWAYGMWEIGPSKNKSHPATFPSEIPLRLMKMLSYVGDTILDPFAGVGTTLFVADGLLRRGIGYENDPTYVDAYDRAAQNISPRHRISEVP